MVMDFIVCITSSARCNIINLGQVFHAFSISLTLISQPKAITIIIIAKATVHILKNKCKTYFSPCIFASLSCIFVVYFCYKFMTDRMDENNNKIDRVSNILLIFKWNTYECLWMQSNTWENESATIILTVILHFLCNCVSNIFAANVYLHCTLYSVSIQ